MEGRTCNKGKYNKNKYQTQSNYFQAKINWVNGEQWQDSLLDYHLVANNLFLSFVQTRSEAHMRLDQNWI